jgi:proteasome lid subunit RPN8/RPN11
MSEHELHLPSEVDAAIRRHGEETYPHECCGALVGRGGRVEAVVALPNTTEEGPRRRFLVRPSDYRLAEARARELVGELVGFYHSHPDHPARPSQYDLDHAWPNFAYVIVAVAGKGLARQSADLSRQSAEGAAADGATAGDMTVWRLKDDRSTFEEGTLQHGDENSDSHSAPAVHG